MGKVMKKGVDFIFINHDVNDNEFLFILNFVFSYLPVIFNSIILICISADTLMFIHTYYVSSE